MSLIMENKKHMTNKKCMKLTKEPCQNGYFKVAGCYCCQTLTSNPNAQVNGSIKCYRLKNSKRR